MTPILNFVTFGEISLNLNQYEQPAGIYSESDSSNNIVLEIMLELIIQTILYW